MGNNKPIIWAHDAIAMTSQPCPVHRIRKKSFFKCIAVCSMGCLPGHTDTPAGNPVPPLYRVFLKPQQQPAAIWLPEHWPPDLFAEMVIGEVIQHDQLKSTSGNRRQLPVYFSGYVAQRKAQVQSNLFHVLILGFSSNDPATGPGGLHPYSEGLPVH